MRPLPAVSMACLLALSGPMWLTACAVYPESGDAAAQVSDLERAELLRGDAFGVGPADRPPPVSLLGLNEDMRLFLREHVAAGISKPQKARHILQALLDDGLNLEYDNFKTFTARETFESRDGNCMSFTNLFVALGRESGLKVSYQEVEVPPSWTQRGDRWLYSKHINALVKLPDKDQVVDFSLGEFNEDYPRRRLSDQAALARYHNNMGVHRMGQGEAERAFLHFREALELDPDASYFWTNLGSLYRRLGRDDAAEKAFLVAVGMDSEPVAMSNLARMYADQGRDELAAYYEVKVESFRRENPFYLLHLAEEAYASGKYEEAGQLLRRAIRLNNSEHEFHRLLGLTYLQQGKTGAAKRQFRQAAELASDPASQSRYRHKLEQLADS